MTNPNHITISAVVAIGNQRQIGKGGQLLWEISEDLKRFKQLTNGKAVIMGRKTWESLPESVRPLPNRENIILTRNKNYDASEAKVLHDSDEAITYAKSWSKENGRDEIFIIGGGAIYEATLPQTNKLYLTLVDTNKDGDAFFPKYEDIFTHETFRKEHKNVDPPYMFINLTRE